MSTQNDPDGMNASRAKWAEEAAIAFSNATRGYDGWLFRGEREEIISDLLSDLHHLADKLGLNWSALSKRADANYEAETAP